ncbi:MAG: flagellar hook-length control protein FliK [Candidatus Puniceispirillaceae bacterium]
MPVVTSEWGKLMNTMEALGAGPNLSPKGETPGLNLGADAEALALFASLFAMMQTQQQNGATAGPVSQAKPQSIENKPLLPAAAMLMAELAPKAPMGDRQLPLADMLVNNPETGEGEPGDTAGLLKLLLAAHDIAAPDHQPMMPATASDDNVTAAAPTRTATEMLTSAIEILKSLEAGATPSGPIKETPDQISTPPAPAMVLQADPNFIGPMPAVAVPPAQSAPAVVMLADQDFVGPMPAAAVPPTQSAPAVVMLADPDFVGPMPAITPPATLLEYAVILPAEPDFIGPMPVIKSASTVKTADASYAALNDVGPAPAGSRLAAPVTKTTESVPNMATIGAASVTATQIETSPETARLSASAAGPSTVPNSSSTPAPPNAPSQGPAHSAVHGPNPDLHPEPEQLVKSGLPKRSTSEKGADKDDGFISRRAGKVTAGKDMNEKMAIQQKAAEIQAKGARMMSKANDLLQGSAASASTSVQALAQQTAVTSQAGNMMSSASASDITQNVAVGAAGGQSGGQSGSQQPGQHLTDGGMARGTADRTLLHRLNIDNAGWSESLVKRLTADLRSGVQNVRIILEPRQLGRLNVELGLRNGQASIRIAAETQEAAKLLSGARGQLGQMLESAGLRLAGFQATGSQAGDTGLDTGQGSQGRGGEEASDNAGRNNAGRDKDFSNKMASESDDKAKDLADGDAALREGETAVLSILA